MDETRAIERSRAEEDQRIEAQREAERSAKQIAEIREALARQLAESGGIVPLGVGTGQAPADVQAAALAATAQQQVTPVPVTVGATGGSLRIEFAPIALTLDGRTVAEVVYPDIEQRLDVA